MIKKKKKPFAKNAVTAPAKKKPAANVCTEWLYINDKEVSVRDIAAAFENPRECEFWEAAGVAEVILTEKASMDLEEIGTDLGDETGNAFLKEQGALSCYQVTVAPDGYDAALEAMKKILGALGGLFCGDTDDFLPQVRL